MMSDKLFSDKIMAMWAIMDLSVKIKSCSDTFWTNIWITFYIFLWNYESIKVGVQLVFNTIWEWHHFTAVIWKNDTKSFIFPKLKMISVQNFEDNTTVLCTFCWTWCFFVDTRNGGHFVQNSCHFFIKSLRQGTCSKIIWSIFLSI
jgi:hypothetical protein